MIEAVPPLLSIPPPPSLAVVPVDSLPERVLSVTVSLLVSLSMPPPETAELSETVLSVSVSVLPPQVQDAAAVVDG